MIVLFKDLKKVQKITGKYMFIRHHLSDGCSDFPRLRICGRVLQVRYWRKRRRLFLVSGQLKAVGEKAGNVPCLILR